MKKPNRTTLRNKLDKLCRDRTRASGKCLVCGSADTLQTHHIIGRRNLQVRWDLSNLVCLCALHHRMGVQSAHQDPLWFTDFIRNHMGEQAYIELRHRANGTKVWANYELETMIADYKEELEG